MRALWTAANGMQSQQITLDVIANNLANVQTSGFKRSRVDFQDLIYQTAQVPGSASAQGIEMPAGFQIGHGARVVATQKLFMQGDLLPTGNPLDIAIEGEGFFQITQPNGEIAYTRDGSLKRDSQGRLVNSEGFLLEPEITIPDNALSVTIGVDGTVSVTQPGVAAAQQVGSLELTRFVNPAGLKSVGHNLFLPTQASGDPTPGTPGQEGFGTILQLYIEGSNVNVVEEMVNLISGQRAYEINSRAIRTADEMMQTANSLVRL
jgi:flagellar basal-body rod protein FlgG